MLHRVTLWFNEDQLPSTPKRRQGGRTLYVLPVSSLAVA